MANASNIGQEKGARKKTPFTAWFKKVTTRRRSGSSSKRSKRDRPPSPARSDKVPIVNQPGHDTTAPIQRIPSNGGDTRDHEQPAATGSFTSLPTNEDGQRVGNLTGSAAPTLATDPDTITSDAANSKSGVSNAPGGAVSTISGGGNSIFSSSNHSSHSLATTLTTVQSTAPSTQLQNLPNTAVSTPTSATLPGHQHHASQGSTYFTHQYPTAHLSAVPPHLQPASVSHLPSTYRSATANNLLTDNASILTLASSSHNANRRTSLDTAASVRAIAPSSQWGGSRESLPLSVLSANTENQQAHVPGHRPSVGTVANSEMAGVSAPVLSSGRNSIYRAADGASIRAAEKTSDGASTKTKEADGSSLRGAQDGASMRSGGHGRNDSLAGSIGGLVATPVSAGHD